ncbi:hypothetical protein ACFLV7_14230 [Chloroflexota bacterium]
MGTKVILFLIAFLITFFLSEIVLMQRTTSIVVGAKSLRLINHYEMIFIDKRLQPVFTVVMDCPGNDSIRLWPLPMVNPWFECRKVWLFLQVGDTIKHPLNYEGVLGDFLEMPDDLFSTLRPDRATG